MTLTLRSAVKHLREVLSAIREFVAYVSGNDAARSVKFTDFDVIATTKPQP